MRKGRSVFSAVPQAKTYFGKSAGKCLTSNHLHSETLWLIPQFVERSRELLGQCIPNYSTAPCYTALLPAALQLQEFSNGDCVKANKKKKKFVWTCVVESKFGPQPCMLCQVPATPRMTPAGDSLAFGLSSSFKVPQWDSGMSAIAGSFSQRKMHFPEVSFEHH